MTAELNPYDPILVIDDEESILLSVDTILQMAGFNNVITCAESRQAMAIIEQRTPSIVLLDLNMPHLNGEAIIGKLASRYPNIPIIVITGKIDAETAVTCMKSGAFDYIVKPVEEEKLIEAVGKGLAAVQASAGRRTETNSERTYKLKNPENFSEIVTQNPQMLSIFDYIEAIARTEQPILIQGETGTGKELIARAVHRSSERTGDFIAVNVAGLDDNVFSDTLFGHARGAYTGADTSRSGLIEKASKGTLFLDEIGDLSPPSQVKLLRLLQEGEYIPLGQDKICFSSARIVTSTHVELWQKRQKGEFRQDLHYRLATHRIQVPPLRKRRDDIPILIHHFLTTTSEALEKSCPNVPSELIHQLATYHFPGNVRELQAMVFDAVAQHNNGTLSLAVFREHMARTRKERSAVLHDEAAAGVPFRFADPLPSIKQATNMLIAEAMKRAGNNQSIAASMLGISQQALSKRLKSQSAKDDPPTT